MVQEASAKWIPAKSSGVDERSISGERGESQLAAVRNLVLREGYLRKGPGYAALSATVLTGGVKSFYEFRKDDDTRYILAMTPTKFYRWNVGDSTWVDITGVAITATVEDFLSGASFEDTAILTNYADLPRKWTGSGDTSALGGSPPRARHVATLADYACFYHCFVDAALRPKRVMWSVRGDAEDWTGTGSGSAELTQAWGPIRNATPLGDWVMIYCTDSIIRQEWVGGDTPFLFTRYVGGKGCASWQGVAVLPDGSHAFIGRDNVYRFYGSPGIEPLGDAIRHTFFAAVNETTLSRSRLVYRKDLHQLELHYPAGSGAQPDACFVLDLLDNTWNQRTVGFPAVAQVYEPSGVTWNELVGTWNAQTWLWDESLHGGIPALIYGDTSGLTWQSRATDKVFGAGAIDTYFETEDYRQADSALRLLGLYLHGYGDPVTVEHSKNGGSTWTSDGTITFTSVPSVQKVWFNDWCEQVRFRVRNQTASQQFYVDRWAPVVLLQPYRAV